MKNTGMIALAMAGLAVGNIASADDGVYSRAYYQGAPSSIGDISDIKYNFAPSAESHSTVSLSADGGTRNADAWAMLDAATGTFKATTMAAESGNPAERTAAWAEGWTNDVLRIASSSAFETVRFTVSYDSHFNSSAVSVSPFVTSSSYPIRHTDSAFNLSLYHYVANPDYVEGGESSATIREDVARQGGSLSNYTEFADPATNGGSNVKYSYYENFNGNALNAVNNGSGAKSDWNGVLSFDALVPTNSDITFETQFNLSSFCFQSYGCTSANDSSHSFHVAVTALGGSLTSQNGYFGITAAVPEPETYAMMLAGLGLLGATARRRARKA